MKSYSLLSLLGLVSFSFLLSCSKSKNDPGQAEIMVINAVPGSAGIDLEVGGKKLNETPIPFSGATGYLKLPAGRQELKVNQMNSTNLIVSKNVSLSNGGKYTLLVYNLPNSTQATLAEDVLPAIAMGKAHARYFNLAPGSAALTVGFTTTAGYKSMFPSRGFETEETILANDGFTTIDAAGNVSISLRTPATFTTIYTLTGMTFLEGKIKTVIYMGNASLGITGTYMVVYTNR